LREYRAACAAAVRRVAAPYKLRVNKLLQILRANDICHCRILYFFERQRNNPSVSVYAKPVPLAGTPKWILRQIPICIFFSYSIAKNKTAAAKLLWLSVFMILFLIPKLP
jgi:hypothetical protein